MVLDSLFILFSLCICLLVVLRLLDGRRVWSQLALIPPANPPISLTTLYTADGAWIRFLRENIQFITPYTTLEFILPSFCLLSAYRSCLFVPHFPPLSFSDA